MDAVLVRALSVVGGPEEGAPGVLHLAGGPDVLALQGGLGTDRGGPLEEGLRLVLADDGLDRGGAGVVGDGLVDDGLHGDVGGRGGRPGLDGAGAVVDGVDPGLDDGKRRTGAHRVAARRGVVLEEEPGYFALGGHAHEKADVDLEGVVAGPAVGAAEHVPGGVLHLAVGAQVGLAFERDLLPDGGGAFKEVEVLLVGVDRPGRDVPVLVEVEGLGDHLADDGGGVGRPGGVPAVDRRVPAVDGVDPVLDGRVVPAGVVRAVGDDLDVGEAVPVNADQEVDGRAEPRGAHRVVHLADLVPGAVEGALVRLDVSAAGDLGLIAEGGGVGEAGVVGLVLLPIVVLSDDFRGEVVHRPDEGPRPAADEGEDGDDRENVLCVELDLHLTLPPKMIPMTMKRMSARRMRPMVSHFFHVHRDEATLWWSRTGVMRLARRIE